MISANFRLYYSSDWLDASACNAIIEKFGRIDGVKVINATNTYLAGLDSTKASALASYLNEDPMMVCSLGLEPQGVTMPIRWLCNAREGDYAYCLTDEIINTATDTLKYRVRTYSRSSNWQVMTPYYKENTLTLQKYGDPYALSVSYGAGTWANVKQGVNTEQGLIVEFRAGTGPYINGSFIPNRYGAFTTPGTYVLGGNNNNNTTKTGGPIDLGDVFEHYRNGVLIHQFAPIVCNTKNGMIDLVNMEFHPNQGTGHFTDAYTLQDGVTPWTPIHDTDSQYLTAAGFGRYRITAASLGNLDLLGTFRWLKAATQQAILGAFGDDGWAVIKATSAYLNGIAASDRDKATALAALLNEDPMMVCSLGLEVQGVTMPIRWLVGDGNSWIDTGEKATSDMIITTKYAPLSSDWSGFGSRVDWQHNAFTGQVNVANGQFHIDITGTRYTRTATFSIGTPIEVYINNTIHKAVVDGQEFNITTLSPSNYNIYVFGINQADSKVNGAASRYSIFEIEGKVNLIPFKSATREGMVDLVNAAFHPNQGTGHFTDAYTLQDGVTPWTPSTP